MKTMNHAEYQARVRTMSDAQLRFVAKDAKEAAEAQPEGENAGYYLDEVCYCANEMARRRNDVA